MPWYMWYLLIGIIVVIFEVTLVVTSRKIVRKLNRPLPKTHDPGVLAYMFEVLVWPLVLMFFFFILAKAIVYTLSAYSTLKRMNK